MKNRTNTFIKENIYPIVFTLFILAAVSFVYFTVDRNNVAIYKDLRIKAELDNGSVGVIAYAPTNDMSKLYSFKGNIIPETGSLVLGYDEAVMMKREKEFSKIGDNLEEISGVETKVGGIIAKTNSPLDMMHFLSEEQFNNYEGSQDLIFIKLKDKKTPKLFYKYTLDDKELSLKLIEGKIENYKITNINGKNYYPLILGYSEAKMMREEKLFKNIGDTLDGFFGKDIIIVGIAAKTDSPLDMMHLMPVGSNDLSE